MQSERTRTVCPLLPVQHTAESLRLSEGLSACTLVFFPVPALVIRRAVLHELAAAADKSSEGLATPGTVIRTVIAAFDAALAAALGPARGQSVTLVREADVALDPVAHLL